MLRRPLPLVLAVLAGLALLLWGMVSLQQIFAQERADARAALDSQKAVLEEFARVALDRRLRARMATASPRIEAAASDPLLGAGSLLLVQRGEQILPPRVRFAAGPGQPAQALYQRLRDGAEKLRVADPSDPWSVPLKLLPELEAALAKDEDAAIITNVRALLNHRSRFLLPAAREVPYLVRYLEVFVHGTTPDPSLLSALLRDGLRGSRGRRLESLQSLLLAQRERFSRPDFRFLAERIGALSERAKVEHADFLKLAAEEPKPPLALPWPLEAPALLLDGRWYAEPLEEIGARGFAVDLDALLGEVAIEMREGGLLGAGDHLGVGTIGAIRKVANLSLVATSKDREVREAAIEGRYRLKTGLGVTLGGLAMVIVALMAFIYRRERRYLQSKSDFVATVSHELRTPLASVRVMGETLERRLAGMEAARDFPTRIVGEMDRLTFLVDNILSYNRLERAGRAAVIAGVSLAELCAQLQGEAGAFTKKPVAIQFTDENDVQLAADPDLARLLFSNLVSNACKYHEREEVEIRVSTQRGENLTVWVRDNGVGIEAKEGERIFTEFHRARAAGKGGFGLGLAICRRIMQLHGGHIRVAESGPGGSTFELTFPAGGGEE